MTRQTVAHLQVSTLKAHPGNVRDGLGDLSELAASIREHGILQPITVTESGDPECPWLVLAGHRRLGAAQLVGLPAVPAVIRHDVTGTADQVVLMLVENCQRRDLGPVEKAEAYGFLRNQGLTQSEIARQVGVRPATVNYYLALLELDDASREQVRGGVIPSTHAVEAVRTARKEQRAQSEQPERGRPVFTDPAHLTRTHPLAEQVASLCDHTTRPRPHGLAGAGCGQCWETVIRASEREVVRS